MKELIAKLRNLVIIDEVGSNNPLGKKAADALEAQQAEIKALRTVLDAAANLVSVKGRHHSEQAYKRLEAAVNAAMRK